MSLSGLILKRNEIERQMEILEARDLDHTCEYECLDCELDDIVSEITRLQEAEAIKQKEREEALIREFDEINELNTKRVVTLAMVMEFGEEFRDNYIIDDTYTVYSHARKNEFFNDNDSWECEDSMEAKAKVNQLIYYRVYDHYFRNGPTHEILVRLKNRIMEIKRGE